MLALANLAVRRPRSALGGWLLAVAVLALLGTGLSERLTQSTLQVPGTESNAAIERFRAQFGDRLTVPVLLQAPAEALDSQGPALVRALERQPGIRVLSPWNATAGANPLRPEPRTALLLPVLEGDLSRATETAGPRVRALVEAHTSPPVDARVTGMAAIGADLKEASLDAAGRAERIAIPALLIVLLLVFRSLVAAAIPALFGVTTVLAGSGLLALLASLTPINEVARSLSSMMGLALGVDYSLLLVARFRENLAAGYDARRAAALAAATAGRTVMFAGLALLAAMAAAVVLSPGDLLLSSAAGVVVVTVLSVAGSFVAAPAALALLGTGVDRWQFGRPRTAASGASARLAGRIGRRPAIAAAIFSALLLLAVPATALDTGPPDVRQLPEGSRARQDFEHLRRAMGPGWSAPFDVVVVTRDGPLTTKERLRALERWQRRIARDPGVADVLGPGSLASETARLERAERGLEGQPRRLRESRRGLAQLDRGLERAADGVRRLGGGLATANEVAALMESGSLDAAGGARRMRRALRAAADGAGEMSAALRASERGAARIAHAIGDAGGGAGRIARALRRMRRELEEALPGVRELSAGLRRGERDLARLAEPARVAEREVRRAYRELILMTVGKADPRYLDALRALAKSSAALTGTDPVTGERIDPSYPGLRASIEEAGSGLGDAAAATERLAGGLDRLSEGLGRLTSGAGRLKGGLGGLRGGVEELSRGLERLASGTGELGDGLARLTGGAARLASGLQRLGGGAGRLERGLRSGRRNTGRLQQGLERAQGGVDRGRRASSGTTDLERTRRQSPGLFDSGYFLLAAIEGAPRRRADRVRFGLSLERGGQGGRIVVVPVTGPNEPETQALRERLSREADLLAAALGGSADVGGAAGLLADYDRATSQRLPLLVAVIALVTFLVLVPIFRSLLLALIGVVLNLVTVGAAFGLLALLFQGANPPLGGPGYVDSVAVTGMFTVIFGLSIDYQVFLIARMREGWVRTGDSEAAIRYGLDRTARVVTGAAAIMTAVFFAFSVTDVANTRQFGVGLAAAVVLDATLVRLLLLPAAMRLGGRWTWWLPRRLDRLLPQLDVEGRT